MSEKVNKNTSKKVVEKEEVITEVDKNENKSEIIQAYRKPLSTLSTYLKSWDSTEQQAAQGHKILKHMRICVTKRDNMENGILE
jgi:hypothetical protein